MRSGEKEEQEEDGAPKSYSTAEKNCFLTLKFGAERIKRKHFAIV